MHQPAKIPSEMWQVFKKIDDIKDKITNSNAGNITAEFQGILLNCIYILYICVLYSRKISKFIFSASMICQTKTIQISTYN